MLNRPDYRWIPHVTQPPALYIIASCHSRYALTHWPTIEQILNNKQSSLARFYPRARGTWSISFSRSSLTYKGSTAFQPRSALRLDHDIITRICWRTLMLSCPTADPHPSQLLGFFALKPSRLNISSFLIDSNPRLNEAFLSCSRPPPINHDLTTTLSATAFDGGGQDSGAKSFSYWRRPLTENACGPYQINSPGVTRNPSCKEASQPWLLWTIAWVIMRESHCLARSRFLDPSSHIDHSLVRDLEYRPSWSTLTSAISANSV